MEQSKKGMGMEQYKEFQKIKEDADFKHDTNQRLQNAERTIDGLLEGLTRLVANRCSDKKEVYIDFENLFTHCVSCIKECRKVLDEQKTRIDKQDAEIVELKLQMKDLVTRSDFDNEIYSSADDVQQLKDDVNRFKRDIISNTAMQQANYATKLIEMKLEIQSAPTEIPEMKNTMNEKLQLIDTYYEHNVIRFVNNEKKIRELQCNIEALYQLIKRLNKQET